MKMLSGLLIGLILSIIVFKIYSNLDTYEQACKIQLKVLGTHIKDYEKKCGGFPSQEIGLKALDTPKKYGCQMESFTNGIPVDPWDGQITYILKDGIAYLFASKPECGFEKIIPGDKALNTDQ